MTHGRRDGALPVSAVELLDRVQVAVLVTDLAGRILQCNRQAELVFGVPRAELIGRLSADFAGEAVEASVIEQIAKHMMRGETWEGDIRAIGGDGSHTIIHAVDTPVLDDDGKLQAIVSAAIDITDRWKLEQRLRAEHAVARVLADAADFDAIRHEVLAVLCDALSFRCGGLWEPDADGRELLCTAFWVSSESLAGFAEQSRETSFELGVGLPGRVWADRVALWVTDVVTDANFPRASIAERAGLGCALACPLVSGNEFVGVMEFFGANVAEPDDEMLDMVAAVGAQVGSFVRRRRAERAVRASEARRSAMLETALDGVVAIDESGRIVEFNPAAERIFGYERAEVLGRVMVDVIVPEPLRGLHREGFARYLRTGEAKLLGTRVETRGLRKNGEEFPVELSVGRVDDPERVAFTAFVRDITNRVVAQRALTDSYRDAAALADTLQQSLLPPHLPEIDDTDLAARYVPAAAGVIGGDFYDVFERGRGDWIVTIGDVCGKGPEAAAATALSRYTIRAAAMEHSKPRHILAMLNDALLRADALGCTAVVARLRTLKGKRRLTVSSGGHPLPLHRYADGTTVPIGRFGTLLGMTDTVRHADVTVELRPNDAVLFYTDGVTELRSGDEFYGDIRLVAALTGARCASARSLVERIEVELRSFQPRFRDDVALLALRHVTSPESGTPLGS
jgi:PAS domain S-box-containing protein